jgi:sugar (pentulose or hexulose) kinase
MMFIGIDLGSTNLKAALYSGPALTQIAISSRPIEYNRENQKVEFDACAVADAVMDMLGELGGKAPGPVAMITLTGQAESLILLGKDGRPLRPAISWMDERSSAECQELSRLFSAEEIYAVTGQKTIIPTWPATKILNLSRTEPDVIAHTAAFIMLKDYIAYRLSGTMAADKSIATFSLYFDIHHGCYWQKMLDICGIRQDQLPPLTEPRTIIGPLDPVLGLGNIYKKTTVNTGTLDHFAGMIGNGIVGPGGVSESTGTVLGISALAKLPLSGRETAPLHYGPFPGTMVLLPVAESGGVCLEWFKNNFLPDVSFKELDEQIKEKNNVAGNLLFLPYLVGVNSPDFNRDACGVFFGLRAGTDPLDMARSVMEGVALLLEKNLSELRRGGLDFSYIVSSGGAAKSDLWSQIKADVCGLEVRIPSNSEAACFGAAIIGSVSSGLFPDYEKATDACVKMAKIFLPHESSRYKAKRAGFEVLYRGMLDTVRAMASLF